MTKKFTWLFRCIWLIFELCAFVLIGFAVFVVVRPFKEYPPRWLQRWFDRTTERHHDLEKNHD